MFHYLNSIDFCSWLTLLGGFIATKMTTEMGECGGCESCTTGRPQKWANDKVEGLRRLYRTADHRNGRTTRLRDCIDSTNSWPQKWANDKVEGLRRLYHGWPQKWANDKVVWCHKPRRLLNWFIAPGGWRDLDKSLFSITPRDGVTGLL